MRALWKRVWNITVALVFFLSSSVILLPSGQQAYAEGPTDPSPEIQPGVVNENTGKKILFDNTHAQTAGAADWVIDGGFSDFANGLANDGFYVKELRKASPITYDDLKNYDVFVIPEANIPYKTTEQDAMLQYVQNGGSIFFIADHYNADRNKNRWDSSEIFNGYRRGAFSDPTKGMSAEERDSDAMQNVTSTDWLATHFGVRFRYNALGDVTANQIISPEQSFGITEGVNHVAMHAGSTLAIVDPKKAKGIVYLPETEAKWPYAVDQGVYAGGGIAEGPYVAISKLGQGKAAFIGDSSPVEDATPKYLREDNGKRKKTYDGFKEQDDAMLLVNLINWLSKKESYTSFDQIDNFVLDQPTPLLDFEDPSASTEPQKEPWADPDPGYKWWDPSTFKPGSYGSTEQVASPAYSFVHQEQLPANEIFQVRVVVDNLPPGTTVSGLNLGVYIPGGTQVAKVQNADGTWPANYGYSEPFSLTADALGHASKDLTIQLKPGTLGDANIRLRQNKNNLKTEAVTIADVPAESLPEDRPPMPDKIPIFEARTKSANTLVTVEGVITTEPGIFGSQGFYLQDETGGIYVYQSQTGFQQGDLISISAYVTEYNSEIELIDPVWVDKQGTADIPAPKVATDVNEENQGQLIQLKQMSIHNLKSAYPTGSFEFDAVNGEHSTHVRVDGRTGIEMQEFLQQYPEGSTLDMVGISSIFRDTYQLKPRMMKDFALSDTVAPVTTAILAGETLSTGSFLNEAKVTLTASDEGSGVNKIEYRTSASSPWKVYEGPVSMKENGTTTIQYRSIDQAGNTEQVKSVTVSVLTSTTDHLNKLINSSEVKPPGLKKSWLIKVQLAEEQFNQVEQKREENRVKQADLHDQLGCTMLEQLVKQVQHTPGHLINQDAKADIIKVAQAIMVSKSPEVHHSKMAA